MTLFLHKDGTEQEMPAIDLRFPSGRFACSLDLFDADESTRRLTFDRCTMLVGDRVTTYFVERGTPRDLRLDMRLARALLKKHPRKAPPPVPLAPLPFDNNIGPRTA